MGPYPDPLPLQPPIGADNVELNAYGNAVQADQAFGAGHTNAQIAALGADPGSMLAHQVAENAAIAAQGAIQQQVLPQSGGLSAVSPSRYSPATPQAAPSPAAVTTASSGQTSTRWVESSDVSSYHSTPSKKFPIGMGEWSVAIIIIAIWFYLATFGFAFLFDPLAYIPPVLFLFIVIEAWVES